MYIEGQNFERYQIIRQLGQGSSGISYEAEDRRLKSRVALKLIQPWSETTYSARRQFFRDMQVLSVIIHPGLATILNYGEVAGQLYLARRYMSQGSLLGNAGRALFPLPLTINTAFTYIHQIAEVLNLIHSHNYVHGSLTFSNVLLAESRAEIDGPSLLLSDAGLAHFVRIFGEPQQNMLPMTAAPEQYRGQTTPASDQYALAILLAVWLTGRPPFAGSPTEIERLKRAEAIPALNAGLTGEQESIIRQALRTRPEMRHSSVLAFSESLLATLPPTARVAKKPAQTDSSQAGSEQFEAILQQLLRSTAEEQEQPEPAQPLPLIEPDQPQTLPSPQPIPEHQPEPAQVPPAPEPEIEPVIIPTPAPDIAQPIPEQTPFPPAPEPLEPQPTPQRETEAPAQTAPDPQTDPLPSSIHERGAPIAYLFITSPFPREPRRIPLTRNETNLGRAGSSDVLLDEDTITSRHHAQINYEGEHYVIYDKRSTHGVTVNDQKLVDDVGQVLKDGDYIQIGDYTLLFSLQPIEDRNKTHVEHALL